MKLEAHLDAYLEHLRRERQVSVHTLDGYRRDLGKLQAFCEAEGLHAWSELDTRNLRRLIARLHQQGLSSRSLARLLSAYLEKTRDETEIFTDKWVEQKILMLKPYRINWLSHSN